jgi:AmmeMemoRadiSam system protein B
VYAELRSSGAFDDMSLATDEAEHSLELHTPFIAHVMRGRAVALVPIMVGALSGDGCVDGVGRGAARVFVCACAVELALCRRAAVG